jgi:hypothetical protein
VSAKAKVLQGAARVHAPLSVPIPETQVRFGPACAGAAEKPQARRAPATDNDAILIMVCPPSNAGEAIAVSDREG